jgi:uncharacterized protein (DUF1778 family)
MEQINFRVKDDEKKLLQFIAEQKGMTVVEFVKSTVMKEITTVRVDLAFQLLENGKIGRKRAWILSGLTYHEFMVEWTQRGASETVPDASFEKELATGRELDLSKYLKNKL